MATSDLDIAQNFRRALSMVGLVLRGSPDATDAASVGFVVVTGVPSGAYGWPAGSTMIALREDAASAATGLYITVNGGTNWSAIADTTTDAELLAIAGLVSAADRLPYFTGSGTAALATFTAAGRAILDDATAAAQATTLGLGTTDSPTFTGLTTTGAHLSSGGGIGAGSGVLTRVDGPDSTHGMASLVWTNTVAPAAIETALFTVPANSVVDSVQATVQTALTGGGTTVTWSIGITGDVDSHGTAGNPTDTLLINGKANWLGRITANAGASLGKFSGTTVDLKLIAAATGGATAGNTALTVGTVEVVVRYRTLISLAD
jgi:hypothetical protein